MIEGQRIPNEANPDSGPETSQPVTDEAPIGPPVLRVEDLRVWFGASSGQRRSAVKVKAVDGVSFSVAQGTTMAIVGESGSGKTTVARVITGVLDPDTGRVFIGDRELTGMNGKARRAIRGDVQMVFQDPHSSLNPRRRIGAVLIEVLRAHGVRPRDARRRMYELLDLVGLGQRFANLLPHQISGGQRQRVGIARALATDPSLVICDEPLSALDVSIQAQILMLLARLQKTLGITYVFISHDLAVVRALANRVAVMYRGRVVEIGTVEEVFADPRHPYTTALLSAVPDLSGVPPRSDQLGSSVGEAPTPQEEAQGCPFRSRCWVHLELGSPSECREIEPHVNKGADGHSAACHFEEQTASLYARRKRSDGL